MRTTLDIDDETLRAAKAVAARRKITLGKVFTEAFREANRETRFEEILWKDGFPILPGNGRPTTVEEIEDLIDQDDLENP